MADLKKILHLVDEETDNYLMTSNIEAGGKLPTHSRKHHLVTDQHGEERSAMGTKVRESLYYIPNMQFSGGLTLGNATS